MCVGMYPTLSPPFPNPFPPLPQLTGFLGIVSGSGTLPTHPLSCGKGGKGFGKGGAKPHHKVWRDNIQAITKPAVHCLVRRGKILHKYKTKINCQFLGPLGKFGHL